MKFLFLILVLTYLVFPKFSFSQNSNLGLNFCECDDAMKIKQRLERECYFSLPIILGDQIAAPTPPIPSASSIDDFAKRGVIFNNIEHDIDLELSFFLADACDGEDYTAIITDNSSYCENDKSRLIEAQKNFTTGVLILIHLWQDDFSTGIGEDATLFIKILSTKEEVLEVDCNFQDGLSELPTSETEESFTCCDDIGNCNTVDIVTRNNWGAKPPVFGPNRDYTVIAESLENYYNTVVIHHSGNEDSYPTVNDVQNKHLKNRADIGYHFAVDREGKIFEGRPIMVRGSHVNQANTGKIGIVLLADLDDENECLGFIKWMFEFDDSDIITDPMDSSTKALISYLDLCYGLDFLDGHNEVAGNCTRCCPGRKVLEVLPDWRDELGF